MLHSNYHQVYHQGYFLRSDGIEHWKQCKLRYGDALAAIAYAFGCPSFEKFKEAFQVQDEYGKDPNLDFSTAQIQMNLIDEYFTTRHPEYVLDIGGGRCEVSCALAYLDVKVQVVEPHILASQWLALTKQRMFPLASVFWPRLINKPVPECLGDIKNIEDIDTLLFVESLEHIPEECFNPLWDRLKPILQKNRGMLIITNWLDYHPLEACNKEHCRRVDDTLYDEISREGETIYRNRSHLVVRY